MWKLCEILPWNVKCLQGSEAYTTNPYYGRPEHLSNSKDYAPTVMSVHFIKKNIRGYFERWRPSYSFFSLLHLSGEFCTRVGKEDDEKQVVLEIKIQKQNIYNLRIWLLSMYTETTLLCTYDKKKNRAVFFCSVITSYSTLVFNINFHWIKITSLLSLRYGFNYNLRFKFKPCEFITLEE